MRKYFRISVFLLIIALLTASFSISVSAQSVERYDPALEGIRSEYYRIDGNYISGIAPGTSVEKLRNACAPSGLTVSGDKVVTGTVLTYTGETETVSLTAVITGDLNGDGGITISDMLMLKTSLLGGKINPLASAAGDLNGDSKVTITDFLKVKSYLLGLEAVEASDTGGRLFLLAPGESRSWQIPEAVSWDADPGELVTVDDTGTITAGAGEGSAFVYALAEDGSVLQRQLVTVLNEPLTLSLNTKSCKLATGKSVTLKATFNHPITPMVQWASSDPSVVTVEKGTLKALRPGTATVTATLENGAKAEVAVTVAPPITHMDIPRTLYKIKPGSKKTLELQLKPADSGEEIIWTSSNASVAKVSADGTVTGVTYGTVTVTAKGKYSGLTASCQVKVCDVIQVALTFDDGPSTHSAKLLDFLKKNDIHVTFFLVGNRINSYPSTVKRQAAEGHEIGYHSYGHEGQPGLSTDRITGDFKKADKLLSDLTGKHFTLWRTPGGDYNDRVLKAVPLPHIMWSVDTKDWQNRNASSVYHAIRKAKDGDIVLLHDLYSTTVDGAIKAMEEMNKGDYEFLTVTELLSRKGTAPEKSKNYFSGK